MSKEGAPVTVAERVPTAGASARIPGEGPDWRGAWRVVEAAAKGVETLGKPVALLLVIVGLLVTYFPSLRRDWEQLILPTARFQVGTIETGPNGKGTSFAPNDYDSPAWNGGLKPDRLLGIVGTEVLTTATADGRSDANLDAQVVTVLDKNQCLHVRDVSFQTFVPGGNSDDAYGISALRLGGPDVRLAALAARARARSAPNCQPMTLKERIKLERFYADRDETMPADIPPFDPKRPVCARTLVWIEAQKVTC